MCNVQEGPMIHSGSIVAAGVSQGFSTSLGIDLNVIIDTKKVKTTYNFSRIHCFFKCVFVLRFFDIFEPTQRRETSSRAEQALACQRPLEHL